MHIMHELLIFKNLKYESSTYIKTYSKYNLILLQLSENVQGLWAIKSNGTDPYPLTESGGGGLSLSRFHTLTHIGAERDTWLIIFQKR